MKYIMIIYAIKLFDEIKYVGQTSKSLDERWSGHVSRSKTSCNYKLYNAIRKHGVNNFTCEMIERCDETTIDDREQYWIGKYDLQTLGYNHASGGRVNRGMKRSDDFKKKLSVSGKNLYYDNSPLCKYNGSQEQKNQLSKRLKDVPKSIEHATKAAQARAKYWYKITTQDTEFHSWSLEWVSKLLDIPKTTLKYLSKSGKISRKGTSVERVCDYGGK